MLDLIAHSYGVSKFALPALQSKAIGYLNTGDTHITDNFFIDWNFGLNIPQGRAIHRNITQHGIGCGFNKP